MRIKRKMFNVPTRPSPYDNTNTNSRSVSLDEVSSHRGLGRSLALGGMAGGGLPGAGAASLGAFVGKKVANKLDREGKSDKEILRGASTAGAAAGAGLGAGAVALAAGRKAGVFGKGLSSGEVMKAIGNQLWKNKVKSGLAIGGLSAAAYLGANKNTKTRLKKRSRREDQVYNNYGR